jgi:hypothetical protein
MCPDDDFPMLTDSVRPPIVHGIGDLTTFVYQGATPDDLRARIGPWHDDTQSAWLYDTGIAYQLAFRRSEGMDLLDVALSQTQIFRIAGKHTGRPRLRVLAILTPADIGGNTPLDFITNEINVRLDLLYLLPGQPLPPRIPDHDIAFFAVGEPDPQTLERLCRLFAGWPRPALNDPKFLLAFTRDTLSRSLSGVPTICSPTAVAVSHDGLESHLRTSQPIAGFEAAGSPYPCLIRPFASHAGKDLSRLATPDDLAGYLRQTLETSFFLTAFEDYRSSDGQYRKSRVAFIDREPFLCHLAISDHWMVHYLNAGMTDSAEKRAQEAQAMADFDRTFARRHAAAFDALHERIGLDYYSIDCAETRDGRLLVFEADSAAIIHLMDPPDMFPYKQPQMRRVFEAFGKMLERRAFPVTAGDRQKVAADPV